MSTSPAERLRVIVVEDGDEYTARFSRLLGGQFSFERVESFASLLEALAHPAAVLLFDLDFRRTDPRLLIDARGEPAKAEEASRLAEVQGLIILRALRARGENTPALLCADLDDPERARLLCEELAPLQIALSTESLLAIAARLNALATAPSAG